MKVSIPLLDVVKQVPIYAKFTKDLLTMKRKISIDKKVFWTKLVNVITECQTPMEYKDPRYLQSLLLLEMYLWRKHY